MNMTNTPDVTDTRLVEFEHVLGDDLPDLLDRWRFVSDHPGRNHVLDAGEIERRIAEILSDCDDHEVGQAIGPDVQDLIRRRRFLPGSSDPDRRRITRQIAQTLTDRYDDLRETAPVAAML